MVSKFQELYADTGLRLFRMQEHTGPLACALLFEIRTRLEKGQTVTYTEAEEYLEGLLVQAGIADVTARQLLLVWAGSNQPILHCAITGDNKRLSIPYGVLQALDYLVQVGFQSKSVATETTYHQILHGLQRLTVGTESDPAIRRAQLLADIEKLQRELALVEQGQISPGLDEVQQQELVEENARLIARLLHDFQGVKEEFLRVTQQVIHSLQDEHLLPVETARAAFNAVSQLMDSAQGRSYQAFSRAYAQSSGVSLEGLIATAASRGLPFTTALAALPAQLRQRTQEVSDLIFELADRIHGVLVVQERERERYILKALGGVRQLMLKCQAQAPFRPNEETGLGLWEIEPVTLVDICLPASELEATAVSGEAHNPGVDLRAEMEHSIKVFQQLSQQATSIIATAGPSTPLRSLVTVLPKPSALAFLPFLQIAADNEAHRVDNEYEVIGQPAYEIPAITYHAQPKP